MFWLVGWFVVGIHLCFDGTARLPLLGGRGRRGSLLVFCWFLSGPVRMMSMVDVKDDPGLVPLYSLLGEGSGGVGGKCNVVIV